MGEAARPFRTRHRGPTPAPASAPARPRLRPAGPADTSDLARMIAETLGGAGPIHEVELKATVHRRQAHDFLGQDGYSLVSNYFLRHILPKCLTQHLISPLQGAILSNMIGRQKRGQIHATHAELADECGVQRTSIGSPLESLCEMNLILKVKRSTYQLNPRVAFNGNGDEQADVLSQLRAAKLESRFPDELGGPLTLFSWSDVG
ncbi:replication/maintenance protein RepL [Streptomyces sp. NPDC090025]|uniref:replication/maintenance protein RepL n=1 Tax=Streptomyces sp. NPDC090025 TaxID=3365922 RepID=UPI0038357B2C